jgi:3-isopropylmalate/(R)-2-methylmalate dehydratase small subunit
MIGASLKFEDDIAAFAQRHWAEQPWVRDVAARTQLTLLQPEP